MSKGKLIARQMLILQGMWLVITGMITALVMTANLSFGWCTGGVIAIIPQSIFGAWAFRAQGARRSRLILSHFFLGETIKLIVTGVLIVMAVVNTTLPLGGVIGGFISTVIFGQVVAPMILSNARNF